MQSNTVIGIVVVVLIVLVGGYFILRTPAAAPTQMMATTTPDMQGMGDMGTSSDMTGTTTTTTTTTVTAGASADVGTPVVVTLTASGFSPASVTVKKGQIVQFVDQTGNPMWVASDPHPTHQGYSGTTMAQHCPDTAGTAFDQCSSGTSYEFTFQKVGSWGYHDHLEPSIKGTVVVTN